MTGNGELSLKLVSVDQQADFCILTWSDGHQSDFHYVWLRDNCRCSNCLHPDTKERLFDILSFDPEIEFTGRLEVQNNELSVKWPDGHESVFGGVWLRDNCYDDASKASRREKPILWTSSIKSDLPEIEFEYVVSGDKGLLVWLDLLCDYGFVLVRNTPTMDGEVTRFAERISHLRETNFGREFDVISKPNPNNVAYTALELQSHSDLPNWELPPGTQFLHCLEFKAEGGESTLVDGFSVAEQLRGTDSDAFGLLAQTPIPFRFHDEQWDVRWPSPTFSLDDMGDMREIRFHAALTAPLNIAASKMLPFYRAYRALTKLVRKPENILRLKLQPGDMLVFNNRRALHGRTAFDPDSGPRHLQGCYVDNDDIMSKRRVLRRRLQG